MTPSFNLIMDILGTIAFAISGSIIAIHKNMDIFGVNFLAITTATGGGIIRDLVIGQTPPITFQNPRYVFLSILTANIVFLLIHLDRKHHKITTQTHQVYEHLLFWCDTLGLAAFSIDGVSAGIYAGYESNLFLLTFLGTVTGVGGGVLRDIIANEMPYIFIKHIYALASICGSLLAAVLWSRVTPNQALLWGFCITILIRWLAKYFEWNLPKLPDEK